MWYDKWGTVENDENINVTSKKITRTEDSELLTGLKQHENIFACKDFEVGSLGKIPSTVRLLTEYTFGCVHGKHVNTKGATVLLHSMHPTTKGLVILPNSVKLQ